MPRSFQGEFDAQGLRFAVIASRFHEEIVEGLLAGALDCLTSHGAADEGITVLRVPGAFEIPTLTRMVVGRGGFDAIVTLGCVLRGDTPHFEFIAAQVTGELSRVAVDARFPIAFGVITCNTQEQAVERSARGPSNKGWEAALAAIEMANLWRTLRTSEL